MNKVKIIILVAIIVLLLWIFMRLAINRDLKLTSPFVEKITGQSVLPSPTPSFNPPKEIKYSSTTDLKKELESIDPQVLESDFNDL